MMVLHSSPPAAGSLPARAVKALQEELLLTPKPGLVDTHNSGAHQDMDHALFTRSIKAISPWFDLFQQLGWEQANRPAAEQLATLRPAGLACEQAMFEATGGVNTHQGGIFSLGLLCCAAGRLIGRHQPVDCNTLCLEVSEICQGIVARELTTSNSTSAHLYRTFSLSGARGEAESGFATVRQYILPYWYHDHGSRQRHHALLRLMAVNADTNLVSRGGLGGLHYVQQAARQLLNSAWDVIDIYKMDHDLIQRNLSPGGSADLLAVATVLADYLPATSEDRLRTLP